MAGLSWPDLSPAWQAAFEEAWTAYTAGSLPIGACIADSSGQVVARGRNRLGEARAVDGFIAGCDLAHAEINALLALQGFTRHEVREMTLYSTVEPCPQCAGAIGMSSLRALNYAAPEVWSGCARLLTDDPYLGRKGFSVSRAPQPLPRLCLLLLLTALAEDGRSLKVGSPCPYRAAFEREHADVLAQARYLHALGHLSRWRREGRTAEAVFGSLQAVTQPVTEPA